MSVESKKVVVHFDYTKNTKVVNFIEVREVQEGATCFCDKKLSKLG